VTSLSKNRNTGCNECQIVNLGTASRKEHKYTFVGPAKGVKKSEAPHINKDSSPLSVLMLFFTEIFHMLGVAGSTDITLPDMMTFVALALQMGHELKDTLYDYWSRLMQLHNPSYGKTMTQNRFLHIPSFLHFADSSQRTDEGEEYGRRWKLRTVFDKLNKTYAKFYNPSEHLAVNEIIVKFKGRVIFRQYILEKKHLGIKICKLCNESGYMYDMRVYLGRESHSATDNMTATHTKLLDI